VKAGAMINRRPAFIGRQELRRARVAALENAFKELADVFVNDLKSE